MGAQGLAPARLKQSGKVSRSIYIQQGKARCGFQADRAAHTKAGWLGRMWHFGETQSSSAGLVPRASREKARVK